MFFFAFPNKKLFNLWSEAGSPHCINLEHLEKEQGEKNTFGEGHLRPTPSAPRKNVGVRWSSSWRWGELHSAMLYTLLLLLAGKVKRAAEESKKEEEEGVGGLRRRRNVDEIACL